LKKKIFFGEKKFEKTTAVFYGFDLGQNLQNILVL